MADLASLRGKPLTFEERRILSLRSHGHTSAQVGTILYMSENTIKTHLSRIMAKLGVNSTMHALRRAHETNQLDLGNPATASPGYDGSVGPFAADYDSPHAYARDVASGRGSCVCRKPFTHDLHTQAAPGVPMPVRYR